MFSFTKIFYALLLITACTAPVQGNNHMDYLKSVTVTLCETPLINYGPSKYLLTGELGENETKHQLTYLVITNNNKVIEVKLWSFSVGKDTDFKALSNSACDTEKFDTIKKELQKKCPEIATISFPHCN